MSIDSIKYANQLVTNKLKMSAVEKAKEERSKRRLLMGQFKLAAVPIVYGLKELRTEPGSDFSVRTKCRKEDYTIKVNNSKGKPNYRIRFSTEGKIEICKRLEVFKGSQMFSETLLYRDTILHPSERIDSNGVLKVIIKHLVDGGLYNPPAPLF
jgi:hypothetical protein